MDEYWTVNPGWMCVCKQVRFLPPALWEYVVIGNRLVSKTEVPGSSPGTPVNLYLVDNRGKNNDDKLLINCGGMAELVRQ